MVSQKVAIKNPTGLHLRPAGELCKQAMQYKSLITFKYGDNTANAKSVLSVLGACTNPEMRLNLYAPAKTKKKHKGCCSSSRERTWRVKNQSEYKI